MRTRLVPLAFAPFLLLLPACEETGVVETDSGPAPEGDAGPPAQRTLTYTPAGCGYEVRTPELEATGMSEDVFDEADDTLDQIHVSWAGPSHTSFTVNWHSGEGTLASRVLYGTDEAAVRAADGPGEGVGEQVGHHMLYVPQLGGSRSAGTRIHEAHVCGLDPSTTYFYKVGGPGHWSEVYDTTTAPEPGSTEPFSFAVTGDSRNNLENSWPISQRQLLEAGVDFQVFSGDAVFLGPNQADWELFFNASDGDFEIQDMLARVPFMMANGNHDQLAINYVTQFAFPQELTEGERAQGEEWYSFDYGNAHFIMLNDTVGDSAVLGGAQADWMRQDLMAVDRDVTPWIFAVHHRPFYTCRSTHSPDTALRAAWQPIFDEFSVDMVLTGHNHVYERSQPIRGLEGGEGVVASTGTNGVPTYDPAGLPSGTVYVVAAGVGAELYEVSTDCTTSYTGSVVRPYVIVEIEDRTLRYTAYNTMNGQVIDEFELTK
jgi:hypothetical protein